MKTCTAFDRFIQSQVLEIKQYRESACKQAGCDLGQEPVMEWIAQNARDFRTQWENSGRSLKNNAEKE